MPEWGHLGERPQHECPLVRPWVRQYDAPPFQGLIHLPVVNKTFVAHNIKVERPRYPPMRAYRSPSPRLRLNPLQNSQKGVSGQWCVDSSNGIQEVGLRVAAMGACPVQPRRDLDFNTGSGQFVQRSTY